MHFTFKLRDQLEGNCPSTFNKGGGSPPPSTTTTSGGIDPEFKPYLKDVLSDVTSIYHKTKGDYGDVQRAYKGLGATGSALGKEAARERANLAQFKKEGAGAREARREFGQQARQGFDTGQMQKARGEMQQQIGQTLGTADTRAAQAELRRQMGQSMDDLIAQDLAKTGAAGQFGAAAGGALGSARSNMAQQGALADRALALRAAENAQKSAAAQQLYSQDISTQQAERQQQMQAAQNLNAAASNRLAAERSQQAAAAGQLAGLDTAAQQRYLSGLEAGQALGAQQYEAAKAGVAAAEGVQEAPHAAAKRYFGYLGSGAMPTSQVSTTSGGGGGGK